MYICESELMKKLFHFTLVVEPLVRSFTLYICTSLFISKTSISLFVFHTVGISAHHWKLFFLHLFNYYITEQNALWVKMLQHNGILS